MIPDRIDLLGQHDSLPVGYTRISYIESSATQYIKIDCEYESFSELGASCDYIDLLANIDSPILSAYRAGNGNNRFYVPYCSSGTIYVGFYGWFSVGKDSNKDLRTRAELNLYASNMYSISFGGAKLKSVLPEPSGDVVSNRPLYLFAYATYVDVRGTRARVFEALITKNKNTLHRFLPALDQAGEPCMLDTISGKAYYNMGAGSFIAGIETRSQLDQMLRNLPDKSGQEIGILIIRLGDTLMSENMVDYINAMSAPKNWNIAYAA